MMSQEELNNVYIRTFDGSSFAFNNDSIKHLVSYYRNGKLISSPVHTETRDNPLMTAWKNFRSDDYKHNMVFTNPPYGSNISFGCGPLCEERGLTVHRERLWDFGYRGQSHQIEDDPEYVNALLTPTDTQRLNNISLSPNRKEAIQVGMKMVSWKSDSADWKRIAISGNPYRNELNRQMKDESRGEVYGIFNPRRIIYQRVGRCDDDILPTISGEEFLEMQNKILELEDLLDNYEREHVTGEKEIDEKIVRLIERSTKRYEKEAKQYREAYYRERDRKNDLLKTIDGLNNEIQTLKEIGYFPDVTQRKAEPNDRIRRFSDINV